MKSGLVASARAMPIRWRWPPEIRVETDPEPTGLSPYLFHELGHAAGLVRFAGRDAVNAKRSSDDLADPHVRIERRIGILEDHLHVPAREPQV
jgi:hypothetical protein